MLNIGHSSWDFAELSSYIVIFPQIKGSDLVIYELTTRGSSHHLMKNFCKNLIIHREQIALINNLSSALNSLTLTGLLFHGPMVNA